jgi:hypothetical protein
MPSTGGREKGGGGKGKGSKKDGVGGGVVCAHCKVVGELGAMKCCGRCRRVHYCSVECQKLHWKSGGHKKVCGKEDGARGDAAGDAPLQNPCPICLDNEDNTGKKYGMCRSCGQMFCESCYHGGTLGTFGTCPTCRATFEMSGQEKVRRLRHLLERPRGRFTPRAQFSLGVCYADGTGVDQDRVEAVRLYRLAANQGYANAQCNLGVCYQKGTGVDQDFAEAARLYRLAADQGDANAQINLGICYKNGSGVDQDHAEAARWYRLAADQGDAGAQYNLGVCYEDGTAVDRDHTEAVRWYRLAADQGLARAQRTLSRLGL